MLSDYEIVYHANGVDINDDWEEITVGEFCIRENASDTEIYDLKNSLFATNIHQLLSKETLDDVYQLLKDSKTDSRLSKLNAIVFLSLKQVGRGVKYNCVSQLEYNKLVKYCLDNNIRFGFDSCGASRFLESVKDHPDYKTFTMLAEPCESLRMSCFINVHGKVSPCSFLEEKMINESGIDIINCSDFMTDVWFNEKVINFRNKSIECANKMLGCPVYNIIGD